jgi:hypothetical protein
MDVDACFKRHPALLVVQPYRCCNRKSINHTGGEHVAVVGESILAPEAGGSRSGTTRRRVAHSHQAQPILQIRLAQVGQQTAYRHATRADNTEANDGIVHRILISDN